MRLSRSDLLRQFAGYIAGLTLNGIATTDGNQSFRPSNFALDQRECTFTALAKQLGVTLIVEGRPLETRSPEEVAPQLTKSSLPPKEALVALAAAYDYEVVEQGKVALLRKRYSNGRDLPCVTLAECAVAAHDMFRATGALNPRIPPLSALGDPLADDLTILLTPSQMAAMENGRKSRGLTIEQARRVMPNLYREGDAEPPIGLPVRSLTSEQRNVTWRIARYFYVQKRSDPIEDASIRLQEAVAPGAAVCERDRNGQTLFGYETRRSATAKPRFTALTTNKIPSLARGHVFDLSELAPGEATMRVFIQGKPVQMDGFPDPSVPTAEDASPKSDTFPTVPLAEAIRILNARSADKAELYSVDPVLAAKPVAVMNPDAATAGEVFAGLATIYGLRVVPDGTRSMLTRPHPTVVMDPTRLPTLLNELTPAPLLRAFVAETQRERKVIKMPVPGVEIDATETMRLAALRRLKAVAGPVVQRATDKTLLLKDAGEDAQQALAVYLIHDCIAAVASMILKPVPQYIAHFNDVILTGGLSPGNNGEPRFSLFLSYLTAEGQIAQGVGFGNARYPTKQTP